MTTTPLSAFHNEHGARWIDFAGWQMPLQYTGILNEHQAVRTASGLFDVSHMGEVHVSGPDAGKYLDYLTPNSPSKLNKGQALYSCFCLESGGIIDDLIIYCRGSEDFLICVNAGNRDKGLTWMRQHTTPFDCTVEDCSDNYALLALQGPLAIDILSSLSSSPLEDLARFTFIETSVAGIPTLLSRTGYTGEDGFELYAPADQGESLARALYQAGQNKGLQLCGLGSRDSLRLEVGYPLYGHELSETISPLQAGLGWIVPKGKTTDYIGKAALAKERAEGLKQSIRHFIINDRRIARPGTPVLQQGHVIGEVVSGTLSPILNQAIGAALIRSKDLDLTGLYVELRGTQLPLQIKKPPLHQA